MACPTENLWKIDTQIDPSPGSQPKDPILLEFCLDISAGAITGEVFEANTFLSRVSGTEEPIATNLSLMTLNFTWPPSNVKLVGFRLGEPPSRFIGKFAAFGMVDAAGAILGPSDGDTGTGTGSQT